MNRESIIVTIQTIFRDVFGDDGLIISESTEPDDIEGWDSLMQITLLEAVQAEFGLNFSLDEIIEMKNVKKIVDGVIGGKNE